MRLATSALLVALIGCSPGDPEPPAYLEHRADSRRTERPSSSAAELPGPVASSTPLATRSVRSADVEQIYPTSFTRDASGDGLVVGLGAHGDWVARVDRDGAMKWVQRFTNLSIGGAGFTSDGGALVAGTTVGALDVLAARVDTHATTIVLAKLDASGGVRSTKGYSGMGVAQQTQLTTLGADRFLLVGSFGASLVLDHELPGGLPVRARDESHRNVFFAEVNAAGEVTSSRELGAEARPEGLASRLGVTAIMGTFLDSITWPPSARLSADPASNVDWPSGFLALLDASGGAYWSRAGAFSGLAFTDNDVVTCVGTAGALALGGPRPSQRLLALRANGEEQFETELPIQSSCTSIVRVAGATYVSGRAMTPTENGLRLVKVDASGRVVATRKLPELLDGASPPLLAWDGASLVAVGVGAPTPSSASPLVVMTLDP